MLGSIELVGARSSIQRVAHGDLVADDEDCLFGSLDERSKRSRIAARCIVEALASREGLIPPVSALPRTIVVDRAAFELSDADVVEERLEQARHVAARERELDGLQRP